MSNSTNTGVNICTAQSEPVCGPFRLDLGEGTYTPQGIIYILQNTGFQFSNKCPIDESNWSFTDTHVAVQSQWADGLEVWNPSTFSFEPFNISIPNTDAAISINGQPAHDLNADGVAHNCKDWDVLTVGAGSYVTLSGTICKAVADGVPFARSQSFMLHVPKAATTTTATGSFTYDANGAGGPFKLELNPYPLPDDDIAKMIKYDMNAGTFTLAAGVKTGKTAFGFTVTDTVTAFKSNVGEVRVEVVK